MLRILLIIGTGSFIGGVSRFLLSRYIHNTYLSDFPWGTFAVNIIGSFIIGIVYGLSERGDLMNLELRMFLTIGLCGGFTTFSTFAGENLSLLKEGDILYFGLYAGLSVFMGILAVYLGNLLVKII